MGGAVRWGCERQNHARRSPWLGLHSVHLVRKNYAHNRGTPPPEIHKYAAELRKLAYTVPNGMGEHELLELSESMNVAADETPEKYKPSHLSAHGAPTNGDL